MWKINGQIIETEKEFRDFCFNITESGKPFKQDFRIVAIAYTASTGVLVETLDKLGYDVTRIS